MIDKFINWFKKTLNIHTHEWSEVREYNYPYFTYSGLAWGWRHLYQHCVGCNKNRLIEGFIINGYENDGYYLRNGFEPSLYKD